MSLENFNSVSCSQGNISGPENNSYESYTSCSHESISSPKNNFYESHTSCSHESISSPKNNSYESYTSGSLACAKYNDKNINRIDSNKDNIIMENDEYILTKKIKKDIVKQEETEDMSMAFVLNTKNRIILISDSRSTTNNSYIDNFKKIVYLPKSQMEFICTGKNIIDDENITDFILKYDNELVGKNTMNAVKYIVDKIKDNLFGSKDIINICGNKFTSNIKENSYYYDINGTNDCIMPNKLLWRNNENSIFTKLFIEENNVIIPQLSILNEKQSIELFTEVIKMQETYNKYMNLPNVVGGDIQILILDKDGCREDIIKN